LAARWLSGFCLGSHEIAASLGLAHTTTRDYLDLLSGAFMARQLLPWHENVGKRVVKAPKVYIRDSGLFHSLMRVFVWRDLQAHPKLGASWEGFALEQVLHLVGERDAYFWATHAGAELDLPSATRKQSMGIRIQSQRGSTTNKIDAYRIARLASVTFVGCLPRNGIFFSLG
jgi:uncharacterized protein